MIEKNSQLLLFPPYMIQLWQLLHAEKLSLYVEKKNVAYNNVDKNFVGSNFIEIVACTMRTVYVEMLLSTLFNQNKLNHVCCKL